MLRYKQMNLNQPVKMTETSDCKKFHLFLFHNNNNSSAKISVDEHFYYEADINIQTKLLSILILNENCVFKVNTNSLTM